MFFVVLATVPARRSQSVSSGGVVAEFAVQTCSRMSREASRQVKTEPNRNIHTSGKAGNKRTFVSHGVNLGDPCSFDCGILQRKLFLLFTLLFSFVFRAKKKRILFCRKDSSFPSTVHINRLKTVQV